MIWNVLISAPYMIPLPEDIRRRLENEGIEVVTLPVCERLSEEELLPVIENFEGVICGDDQFTKRVLRRASRLKVISKWGTGIDSIDVEAATELSIQIFNTRGAFTDAVADTTLGYMLCFARNLLGMDQQVRRGLWVKPDSVSLSECALGIIGIGNIGRAVAHRRSE
jgi:D-3-phosphoglycerate dehydrogenase / 2-oxoglutarate reductase